MITTDGLVAFLESLVAHPMTLGLYVNEPDGDVVRRADLEEPPNYTPIMMNPTDWSVDRARLLAIGKEKAFPFSGRAGKVSGYYLAKGDRILSYEPFLDPIPVNTNRDVIRVEARLEAMRISGD